MNDKQSHILKIALIEFGESHDECLLSQAKALYVNGIKAYLYCSVSLWERNPAIQKYIVKHIEIKNNNSWRGQINLALFLRKNLLKNKINKLVFNTAQGALVRNLCLITPRKIELIGILHTIKKLKNSFTQKIISLKIKRYLVLNQSLLNNVKTPSKIKIGVFYPLEYTSGKQNLTKDKNKTWIVIPGEVQQRRKDLLGSVKMMKEAYQKNKNLLFIFLGKKDPSWQETKKFVDLLKKDKIYNNCKFFNEFIDNDLFMSFVQKADFLWPMVHPNTESADEYFVNQISGTINLSFSLKIPLLIHQEYSSWEDFNSSSILYTKSNFSRKLNSGVEQRNFIINKMKNCSNFSKEKQLSKYLNFIKSSD